MTDYAIGRLADRRRRYYSAAAREGIKRRPGWEARKKDLEEKASRIKLELRAEGVVLNDTRTGTTWARVPGESAEVLVEME